MKKIICFLWVALLVNISNAQGPKNLVLLDTLNIGQNLAGVWHYQNTSGKEYAIFGAEQGICIADITNPTDINLIVQLPGVSSIWHEVKVLGDYAYAVSEGIDANNILNGLQIIDLRYLPDSAPYKFYTGDGLIANQIVTSHSITADGHTVFLNGHNITSLGRGVLMLDVTDPWNPTFINSLNDNYCHDSYVRDNYIYTSDIYIGQFSIYDISNMNSPVLKASQITPAQFNHNTWLSDDGNTIFTADERSNAPLGSYDISDFNNISLLDTFFNGNLPSREVHNVRIKNDYAICASYGSQLTVVDVSRPKNMIEIGNYPTGTGLCWDADPYTSSGSILATDMIGVFYVFQPHYQRACYLEGIVTDSVSGITLNGVDVQIQGIGINALTNPLGEFYTGYADTGTYVVQFSKAGYISQSISFNFQSGVVDTISVKLVPIGAGIDQVSKIDFAIYPNPASDQINIQTESKECQFRIYDIASKLIHSGTLVGSKKSIQVKDLPAGNYSLQVSTENSILSKQFVIIK